MIDPMIQFLSVAAVCISIVVLNRTVGLSFIVSILEMNSVVILWTGWRVFHQDYLFLQPCLVASISSALIIGTWLFFFARNLSKSGQNFFSISEQIWSEIKSSFTTAVRLYLDLLIFVATLGRIKISIKQVVSTVVVEPKEKKQSQTEKWLGRHKR